MKLSKLLERLEYEVVQGSVETEVTTLANDSRKVESGSVFVCISGAVFDGHQYVSDVAEKGAAAIIAERGYRGAERGDGDQSGKYEICAGADVCGVFRISGREAESDRNYRNERKDDDNISDPVYLRRCRT